MFAEINKYLRYLVQGLSGTDNHGTIIVVYYTLDVKELLPEDSKPSKSIPGQNCPVLQVKKCIILVKTHPSFPTYPILIIHFSHPQLNPTCQDSSNNITVDKWGKNTAMFGCLRQGLFQRRVGNAILQKFCRFRIDGGLNQNTDCDV